MEESVKASIINSLAYIKELCEKTTPENWPNATLAAMAVADSTIDTIKDD